ncbi:MAG: amino acid ABC transporter substrate-binding protein [Proteobacteria bacterium]|nr:amino acid ABC transporter substrate-binding protein [Pseudomonadota bacterium]
MRKSFVVLTLFVGALAAGTAVGQAVPDTLGRIRAAKAINVAYSPESLPFSFRTSTGDIVGYSIDVCKRVIAQIGRAVNEPNLKVNWIPGSVSERLAMVASGRADLECANTSMTQMRLASVDFSNLIWIDAGGFIVKAGAPINQVTDLNGKRVAVLKGTTTEGTLAKLFQAKLVNATIVPITDALEGIRMLEAGQVDAYAGDKIKLVGLATQAKDPNALAMLVEEISYEPYAFALPRYDSALRLEVNRALTQVYVGGDIDQIYGQWFGKLGKPTPLLSAMFILNSIPPQ